jgi:hypothetical protein
VADPIPRPWWKNVLQYLFTALGALKSAGVFSKEAGINLPAQRFMVGNAAPQPLLGGLKAKVKGKIVEAGIKNIQKKIDTPEERKTIIDGIHVPGIPARFTWLISALGAVAMALMDAASHADPALLLAGEIKGWVMGVVYAVDWGNLWQGASAFIALKIAFWTRQDSHNSTVVLDSKVVKGIASEVD